MKHWVVMLFSVEDIANEAASPVVDGKSVTISPIELWQVRRIERTLSVTVEDIAGNSTTR